MKTIVVTISLLFIICNNSSGQWYYKKYYVTDVTQLSLNQLQESLKDSKKDLLYSGGVAVVGGLFILVAKYGDNRPDENSSVFEQLLGEKGITTVGLSLGIGMLAGGAVEGVIHLSRIGTIKSVIINKYPPYGSLNLSPSLITDNITGSVRMGFTVIYYF